MPELPRSSALLRRVARRMRLTSIGQRAFWVLVVLSGVYALVLLTSRLTGLFDVPYAVELIGALPLAAALVAAAWHRRPTVLDAARRVDQHGGSKDLFLTVALLENSAGEYQPLVARDAEARAASVRPELVVPFRFQRQFRHAVGLCNLLLLAAVYLFIPQLDPFGKVEAAQQIEHQKQDLIKDKKETQTRTAELMKDRDDEGEHSEEVARALEGLKVSLNKMKPLQKQQNAKTLAERQKQMGNQWQKISAETLKDLLKQAASAQQFGGVSKDKLAKWTRELQEGSTESLEKEIEEIKEELQQLMQAKDPVKRAEMQQRLKKRMSDLQEFASENVNSKPLAAALERAMKQMEAAKQEGMSTEALEAASESMNLSKLELKEIAQSAKDLKALEEALKVIQMAKQLNDKEGLDGEACENCSTLADYEELYAQLAEQYGFGDAMEENRGMGGDAEAEDESVETGFKVERSKSPIVKGKVLLSLKTKGLSDTGDAVKEYRDALSDVKQGVSEAIEQEQVPPGYHEGIKSYFDSIKVRDSE